MQIFNSITRTKETLEPIVPGKVTIYNCGPTVYDYFHIGNARCFVTFDLLRRYLVWRGMEVKYVQNFTDIDDKMIQRAQQEETDIGELADRFIRAYFEDADALGVQRADVHPRATHHIGQIIGMIVKLQNKGLAYEADGDVYFDTKAYPDYGKLTGQNLEDLEAGARVEIEAKKKNPMDFALWKAHKPGEPAWDSPWGKGRPGWHIECSAMATHYLGDTIDIHSGGQDLAFPHHENEIAQSQGATGKPFSKYFMHNGYININNTKMSKSEGNYFTVRDIGKEFDLEILRMFLLSSHYRSPINYTAELLRQAQAALERLYTCRDNLQHLCDHAHEGNDEVIQELARTAEQGFIDAMDDDLNCADALGSLFEFVREVNTHLQIRPTKGGARAALSELTRLCSVLGLLQKQPQVTDPKALALADERWQARQQKDWAKSDRLREDLMHMGYVVEDTPQGSKLRRMEI